MKVISFRKVPGKNQLIIDVSITHPLKLSTGNVTVSLTNNALQTYTMKMISYTHYQFDILYSATIQSSSLKITLNTGKARLLREVRFLQSATTFDFIIEIDSYPPSVYYPETVTNLFDGLSLYLKIISGITLVFAILGFIGAKRTLFYSIELFNLIVIIYTLEGPGLVGRSDWIAYSILGMKSFVLIGGFSLGDCDCPADIKQYTYGYNDQLLENCGYMLIVDAVVVFLLGFIWMVYKINLKCRGEKEKNKVGCIDVAWIYYRYYALTILLTFNGNVVFSSGLTLYTFATGSTMALANVILAIVILSFCAGFFILLIVWLK